MGWVRTPIPCTILRLFYAITLSVSDRFSLLYTLFYFWGIRASLLERFQAFLYLFVLIFMWVG